MLKFDLYVMEAVKLDSFRSSVELDIRVEIAFEKY